MRMIISIALETAQIPQEYRPLITDMMYDGFKRHNVAPDFEKYFSQEVQPYCFSVYLPKSRFEQMIMLESPKIKVIFSTCEQSCYEDFLKLFQAMTGETQKVAGNTWMVRSIADVQEKQIVGDCVHIRMMSPLIVIRYEEENEQKPHLLGMRDGNFEICFNKEVEKLAEVLFGMPASEARVRVFPCEDGFKCKDVHVLHGGRYLRSTVGDMMLCGDERLLKGLYQSGLGEFREKGFGLFEVVD